MFPTTSTSCEVVAVETKSIIIGTMQQIFEITQYKFVKIMNRNIFI